MTAGLVPHNFIISTLPTVLESLLHTHCVLDVCLRICAHTLRGAIFSLLLRLAVIVLGIISSV